MRISDVYPIYIKFNYKCKEHDGSFTCDLNVIKNDVKALHEKRSEGHINLRGKLLGLFSDTSRFKVTGRLKTPQSIQEKMKRKGVTDPSQFDDISGLRVWALRERCNNSSLILHRVNACHITKVLLCCWSISIFRPFFPFVYRMIGLCPFIKAFCPNLNFVGFPILNNRYMICVIAGFFWIFDIIILCTSLDILSKTAFYNFDSILCRLGVFSNDELSSIGLCL
jgi:hypothetical protein